MKHSLLLVLLMFSVTTGSLAQNLFKENDARWVIGVEAFVPADGTFFSGSLMTGLVVEKPLGQFSVSGGLHMTTAELWDYKPMGTFVENRTFKSSADIKETYAIQSRNMQYQYLAAGMELKYRLPCNCIFVYSGIKLAKLKEVEIEDLYQYTSSSSVDSSEDVRQLNKLIDLGIGANIPFSKRFRMVFKFGPMFSDSLLEGEEEKQVVFDFSFGLQYGFK